MQERVQVTEGARMERSGELPVLYVNSVQMKVSIFDLQLMLGLIQDITEDQTVQVKNLLTVIVSPQLGKALLDVLTQNLKAYEDVFGPIQITPAPLSSAQIATASPPPSSRSRGVRRRSTS